MIAVLANPSDHDVIREFFELFKTPWEFYRPDGQYDVLLCSGDLRFDRTAKLICLYAGRKAKFDEERGVETGQQREHPCLLSYQEKQIPIYGDTVTFPQKGGTLLVAKDSGERVAYLEESNEGVLARIGYDLFGEIRRSLTTGQPAANAHLPAIEMHIAFLRDLIAGSGVGLVEIPPVPQGHPFIACLTHDVDHPSIRKHKWGRTTLGFLYRAIFGSLFNLVRARMPFRDLLTNWGAALKLPLVQLGIVKDFWSEFAECYLEFEKDLPSTFFLIPFKNYAGKTTQGLAAPALRAAPYEARDIESEIRKLVEAGSEVGLHGIDAWLDSAKGREELIEVQRLTGASEIGVRMHWLYFDQQSPKALEKAGAAYDSTVGYNETVGYRAGTTQAFKPLGVSRLIELPLHVMDTALFYPDHLGLDRKDAEALIRPMVENVTRYGGCLTINWHDRSIAPERLWGACYRGVLGDLRRRGAWFASAGQAVSWFQKRREARFEVDRTNPGVVRAKVVFKHGKELPGLRLRIHTGRGSSVKGVYRSADYVDLAVDESVGADVPAEVKR